MKEGISRLPFSIDKYVWYKNDIGECMSEKSIRPVGVYQIDGGIDIIFLGEHSYWRKW